MTRRGGVNATESADGRALYYARDIELPGLCRALPKPLPPGAIGLALSPDQRSLLFPQLEGLGTDLMLLQNFR